MHLCEQSFSFVCSKRWSQLERLPEANVRYCGQCQRAVHKVTTPQEFDAAQAAHHCIAWVRPKTSDDDSFMVGDVSPDWSLK